MAEIARERPEIVGLTADLGKYTDIHPFRDAFPDRFFNVGMAEQNLIAVSAGLARTGRIPYCTTYGVFATRRAYDFIAIACAHSGLNVKIIAGLPGLTNGYGGTHQAIDDLGLMRMVPGLTIIDPCDATDIMQATKAIADVDGPVYMRLLRASVPVVLDPARYRFQVGKASLLRDGGDVALIGTGLMTGRALEAATALKARGIDAAVLHVPTLKPFDTDAVLALAAKVDHVVTVENHMVTGGLASIVVEAMFAHGVTTPLTRIGASGPLHRMRLGAVPAGEVRAHERSNRAPRRRPGAAREADGAFVMKITRIETFTMGVEWKNWLFLRVHTDDGLHGVGEGTLNGFIATTEAAVHEFSHLAIGQDPRRINALSKRLMDSVSLDGGHIHRTAVAAIEVACWDILGKSLGVPVHQLLGGRVRDSILGYANGWYRAERTPEAFVEAAENVVRLGFKAAKLDPFGTAQGLLEQAELEAGLCDRCRDPRKSSGPNSAS